MNDGKTGQWIEKEFNVPLQVIQESIAYLCFEQDKWVKENVVRLVDAMELSWEAGEVVLGGIPAGRLCSTSGFMLIRAELGKRGFDSNQVFKQKKMVKKNE